MPNGGCWISLRDAAGFCGVDEEAVRQWAKDDSIELTRLSGGWSVDRRDLRACLSRRGLRIPAEIEQWPRVLVADDDPDMRKFADWLIHYAWIDAAVRVAKDGDAAWRALHEFLPDLFVMDLRMPGESGVGLCRMIRESSQLRRVKILAVTGFDHSAQREELMGYVDGYLAKPFEPRELREIVSKLIGAGGGGGS